jgi:nucleotide-binding universal stress UspA family protein
VAEALTFQGPVLTTILDHARQLEADLLILGSHQHNALYRLWYGDAAVDAIKQAPCTLLIIPVTC